MKREQRLIWLQVAAPPKPRTGEPCNGCGVCCAAEPCPLARVFFWQWRGACRALEWVEEDQHYRCGMLRQPARHLPYWPASLPPSFQALLRRLIARWIAAGTACDADAVTHSPLSR